MAPEEFLSLCAQNPQAAADHLDQAAETLRKFAGDLRATQEQPGAFTSGMTDRVRMNVVTETGHIKQSVDTQEQLR